MKKQYLGIEFGSTRIKSVLIDQSGDVIAKGSYEWENILLDGVWTYSLEDVHIGLRESYALLAKDYKERLGEELCEVSAIGISAMMHGYLAFDKNGEQLVPFRTWRNTCAEEASTLLSSCLGFNIPSRWSVAHLYQAVLNGEVHVKDIAYLTTLAGYVHYILTGKRVLGVGDASGMFPIKDGSYDRGMLEKIDSLLVKKGVNLHIEQLLPRVLFAGENAGCLTEEGAHLLDPTGKLKAGCMLCPPEGDAGTGMVATNCVAPCSANVSAGTSAFLMAVLERELTSSYREIDMVCTPHGKSVAMIHANNFASEITAWANLFEEVLALGGVQMERGALFNALYAASEKEKGDGGIIGYNFLAGEPIAGVSSGAPAILRTPQTRLSLSSFMKMHIYSALAPLSMGMDILRKENVCVQSVCGHGGFFKTESVGQRAMSAALGTPITVMKNASEGGAWGIAVLACFAHERKTDLEAFLSGLFSRTEQVSLSADKEEEENFARFMEKYKACLDAEKQITEVVSCWKS